MKQPLLPYLFAGALMALLAGCASGGGLPQPPSPRPKVNAALPKHQPLYGDSPATNATAVLAVTCTGWKKFGETHVQNWTYQWYEVTCTVNRVEHGAWPDATLTFICHEGAPDPASGLPARKQKWPYEPGAQMRFFLDARHKPAQITGQQWLTPPAGALPGGATAPAPN